MLIKRPGISISMIQNKDKKLIASSESVAALTEAYKQYSI